MRKNYENVFNSLDMGKKGNVTISIANGVNKNLTSWCKKRGIKKSHLIEKLVYEFLKDNKGQNENVPR